VSKAAAVMAAALAVVLAGSCLLAQAPPTEIIVLKDAPVGKVHFDHSSHLKVAAKCEVCHHASSPLKPTKTAQEACTDCHTRPATPPVTTSRQAAFHNPTATAGLCITCHKTQNEQGKAAPVHCTECHKPEKS
jgi:hypothetical protein